MSWLLHSSYTQSVIRTNVLHTGLTSLHGKLRVYQQKLRQEAEANFRAQSRQQPQRGRATQ